jgi:hypothetical protein
MVLYVIVGLVLVENKPLPKLQLYDHGQYVLAECPLCPVITQLSVYTNAVEIL